MIVAFEAVDHAGRRVSDTIEAPNEKAAMETLRQRQLIVTSLGRAKAGETPKERTSSYAPTDPVRLSVKQLSLITRQTAMLLTAGSTVVPALSSIAKQMQKPADAAMLQEVIQDVEEGSSLADALRKHPLTFDPMYCAIVAAGEASGALPDSFHRLAKIVGRQHETRRKIVGAMMYPVLLSGMCTGVLQVLLFFVLPRFEDLFATLGAPLPAVTLFLLKISSLAIQYWPVLVGGAMIGVSGAFYLGLTTNGRRLLSSLITQLPVVRGVTNGLLFAQTFRVLGTLIESRVGILEAIDLVREITINKRFQKLYSEMESEVTSGGSLSRAMEGFVPAHFCQAVRTGEESGNLGGALNYAADILDSDNSELIDTLTKLLEPAILIVMGFVVGVVAISLFVPLFEVTSAIGA
ncbi:MAG: type II secretion system F family protein [Planctomycetes bacterium]|nr:type II secretion system F family protein [Planctomycetota bacterium]